MRLIFAAAFVAICVAGAAIAQETPPADAPAAVPPPVVQLPWRRQPDARDFAHAYPSRAADQGLSGAAVMCCTVRADGRLDCTVPFSWPRDYGFDEATLRISQEFRLDEQWAAEHAGGRIRRQIVWVMGSRTPELDAVLTRIREGTQNLCGPAIDWSERSPSDVVVTATGDATQH